MLAEWPPSGIRKPDVLDGDQGDRDRCQHDKGWPCQREQSEQASGQQNSADPRYLQGPNKRERSNAVDRECDALGHHEREQIGIGQQRQGRQNAREPERRAAREDDFCGEGDRQHAEREQRGVHHMHGDRVDLAFGAVAHLFIGLDDAIDGAGKALVELGCSDDEPGIDRREKFARRRRCGRAVHLVEHPVAERAVVIEVVGDGQVERLIEVGQPLRRLEQDRGGQDREHDQAENDPGAAIGEPGPT